MNNTDTANTTRQQFDGYEVVSYRSATTGKPIKYEAITEGGNSTGIVKKASDVHTAAQELVRMENAAPDMELKQPSLGEIAEMMEAEDVTPFAAPTEEPAEDELEQPEEAQPVVTEETTTEEPQDDQGSAEEDFSEDAPQYEAQVDLAYSGAPKDFWRALGRQGAQAVAGGLGILAQPDNRTQTIRLSGSTEDVQLAVRLLEEIWPGAIKAARAWFRNADAYQGATLKTTEGRKIRFGLKEQFLRDFARGYAASALAAEMGIDQLDNSEIAPGYTAGRNAYSEARKAGE